MIIFYFQIEMFIVLLFWKLINYYASSEKPQSSEFEQGRIIELWEAGI